MTSFLNATTHNVVWFKNASASGELDMAPPYQRNPVWLEKQKSYLIDTILNGLPIPELYMQSVVTEEGAARYIVVDGQQRIRAVLEFLEGRFAIDAKDSPRWGDMYFDDLSGDDKKRIYQYNFVVRQLPEMDDQQIRGIFGRLNRNTVALNSQELRKATYWGPFIHLMEELSDEDAWREIGVFSANDVRRMLDVEFVSEIAVAYLNGHQNKKTKLDAYYELYEQEFEDELKVKRTFRSVLGELRYLIVSRPTSRWSKKTDLYTLFLVLASRAEFLPLSEDKRSELRSKLLTFGLAVDAYLSADAPKADDYAAPVVEYGAGVRASSDLGSRKRRFDALTRYLENTIA